MKHIEQWNTENNYLYRVFEFNNFIEAVEFVNKLVPLAEDMNHHPDIEIFSYKKVKIKLTTHDVRNKITKKDIKLAQKINDL